MIKQPVPLADFTAIDFAGLTGADLSHWIAVLPLGATEQHGPHLPLETDTLIAEGMAGRLAERVGGRLPVTFLPAEPVGYSPEHLDWPGTKSLAFDDAVKRWVSLGEVLAGHGIRRLVLLNAHGGNSPLLTIVATELRCRFAMLCVATSWTRFGYPEAVIAAEDAALDIHAGLVETSVMLALHPERVAMDRAQDFANRQSTLTADNRFLSAYGRHAFGWKMQDLNPDGAAGNAADATAAKGEKIIAHAIDGLATLLEEIGRFDLSTFAEVGRL